MAQLGNKKNSQLNREWAKHVRKRHGMKRLTSKRRRADGEQEIRNSLYGEGRKKTYHS
jgi:hypothetical protein